MPKKVRHYLWAFFIERKLKYDYAFKLECVKLALEKHYSCNYVFNQKGLNGSRKKYEEKS